MPTFKAKLSKPDSRMTLHICTIPSAIVPQAMAAAGADGVIIDMEHGAIDHACAHAMIAATAGADCAPLVRVAENAESHVKRVLDLGAEGIVFPLIRTADDARRAVASTRFPPHGTRGFGPFIAQSRWNTSIPEYAKEIEPHLIVCLLIETRDAIENIEEICAVDGIDLIVPAQFDLSTDLGISGQFDHPDMIAAVTKVEDAAHAAGIALGLVGLSREQADAGFAKGYKVIAGFDAIWLRAAAEQATAWTK